MRKISAIIHLGNAFLTRKSKAASYLGIATLMTAATAISLSSCANIGTPDGGRYDEEPPVVKYSSPDNKATGVRSKKINIHFNEYVKLENASEKVVISPPQVEQPNVRAVNKNVKVDLYDALQDSTTYTIDFGDAIEDNNEGNPMGKYTFSFSTGETIDTMEVSGTVLNAENLEPVKGILVGLYAYSPTDWVDSLFTSQPFLRVGRTNGSGQFTIKGVKNGTYRAFALQDMDGDYRFSQKSETIAWDTLSLVTSNRPDIQPDTVWIDTATIEKIVMVPFIHYYPDNVVLFSFLEAGQDKHLLKMERLVPDHFTLYFTAPQDSMPILHGLSFDDACLLPEPSEKNDTITYWLTDTLAAYADTLTFSLTYMDTDTLGVDNEQTDTLTLVPKMTHSRIEKQRQKQIEDWNKERAKLIKKSKEPLPYEANPYETIFMECRVSPGSSISPNQNVTLTFNEPIAKVDWDKLHFYLKVDSEYVEEPYLLLPVEGSVRQMRLYAEWKSATSYKFEADSLAFLGALGHYTKSIKQETRVRSDDEFGSIFVRLIGGDTEDRIVQLLDKSDKPVAEGKVEDGRVDFFYLKPADYYLRMFIDKNGNGVWDTGEYASQTQPEEVFYFPRPLTLRARFEMEQSWEYRAINPTKQKPSEITKQKADKEKTIKNRNAEREQEKQSQRRH